MAYLRTLLGIGIETGCRLGGWGSTPGRGKILLYSTVSIPTLKPNQPSNQYVPRPFTPRVKRP
jgi:hypothetical protein